MPRILIVGAGAIGSAYGYFADRGGAEVSFLVKPKHVAERENGIRLYLHQTFRTPESVDWKNFKLYDSIDQLPNLGFSVVIITVPSNALRPGEWLSALAKTDAAKGALWLCLSPGEEDAAFVLERTGIDVNRFADGSIPILSYWGPLPGEKLEVPGYAFWLPPSAHFVISTWSASSKPETELPRWKAIADVFNGGGFKTELQPRSSKKLQIGPALLRAVVASLQNSEWSFQKFLNGPNLHVASEAAKEALAVYAAIGNEKNPAKGWLKGKALSPIAIRAALALISRLAPFDFEAFLQVHFTKVEEQMRDGVKYMIREGAKRGLPTNYLRQL